MSPLLQSQWTSAGATQAVIDYEMSKFPQIPVDPSQPRLLVGGATPFDVFDLVLENILLHEVYVFLES